MFSSVGWSDRMAALSHLRILLAEDNVTNQKLLLRQLQVLGVAADVVSDGAAAVNAVMRSPYDLILMDCQMPLLDGFEATLAIRDWEQQQRISAANNSPTATPIVIVAMTASDLQQDRDRAMASGMNDYLPKPVRHEVLSALLSHWSQVRSSQAVVLPCSETSQTIEQERGFFSSCPQSGSLQSGSSQSSPLQSSPLQSGSLQSGSSDLSQDETVHLDFSYLHRLSDDSPEFEIELLQIFVNDSQKHLACLRQSIEQQDFGKIERHAHHIKGSSANIGAMVMQIAAAQLENLAVAKHPEPMPPLVAQIAASLQQIQHLSTERMTLP